MSNRLQPEVWALDRCSGCGACVAACSKDLLYWGEEQHPLLEERQKALGLSRLKLRACEVCQRFCEEACPRLIEPAPREMRRATSARCTQGSRRGDPNSVIQALLVAARSADLIDGAILLDLDPWSLAPFARIVTTVDEIVSTVGMQFLWAPVLSRLNEAIFTRGLRKLAIVGPPCAAAAARRLMETRQERLRPYRQSIRLALACFCTGMYLPNLVGDLLQEGLGVASVQVRGLTAHPSEGLLRVTLWDGPPRDFPLTQVQPFTRRGCGSCHDYLGESADLAVGAVGALRQHATLITRTAAGEALLWNAIRMGLLQIVAYVDEEALRQASAAKDRRARAEAMAECHILMLEALGDPKKRAEARRQFVSLYGLQPQRTSRKEDGDGSCDACSGAGC